MRLERIELVNGKEKVWLDCYIADKLGGSKRKALLVIPGGGYGCICNDREGEPIALAFMPYGFNAFVLSYSVGKGNATFPQPLIEASLAMKHIKDNAEEYGIDADNVFAVGFSAGGHLCAALGTMWHLEEVNRAVDMPYGYNKPKGIIPVYPVISSDNAICHKGSFNNITDENAVQSDFDKISPECYVDKSSSPAFIVHTANDQVVNVKNSLVLANAYAEQGIPFELHIFENAPHGMALSNAITAIGNSAYDNSHNAKCVELAAEWMKEIK